MTIYDAIGRGYRDVRRPDPRIASAIWTALGDASSVVNVGAGTGSYEPDDRELIAVEPSGVMISQRPAGAAPAIQAAAEALPLPDQAFDAAMAVLTLQHWQGTSRCSASFGWSATTYRKRSALMAAFWGRPEAYLDSRVRAATSPWHQLPPAAVTRALDRLRWDLADGWWDRRYGHLRQQAELDVGLRLVAADVSA